MLLFLISQVHDCKNLTYGDGKDGKVQQTPTKGDRTRIRHIDVPHVLRPLGHAPTLPPVVFVCGVMYH